MAVEAAMLGGERFVGIQRRGAKPAKRERGEPQLSGVPARHLTVTVMVWLMALP